MAQELTDEAALDAAELFPTWQTGTAYVAGERVRYEDVLYQCLQAHTSQDSWNPNDAASLWSRVLIPDPEIIPDWVQPDSTNPYSKGDKVRHNGHVWVSDIDGNVWQPGVYGWSEVVDA
jgi:hypothetical protein